MLFLSSVASAALRNDLIWGYTSVILSFQVSSLPRTVSIAIVEERIPWKPDRQISWPSTWYFNPSLALHHYWTKPWYYPLWRSCQSHPPFHTLPSCDWSDKWICWNLGVVTPHFAITQHLDLVCALPFQRLPLFLFVAPFLLILYHYIRLLSTPPIVNISISLFHHHTSVFALLLFPTLRAQHSRQKKRENMPRISPIQTYYFALTCGNVALLTFAWGRLAVPMVAPFRKERGKFWNRFSGMKKIQMPTASQVARAAHSIPKVVWYVSSPFWYTSIVARRVLLKVRFVCIWCWVLSQIRRRRPLRFMTALID